MPTWQNWKFLHSACEMPPSGCWPHHRRPIASQRRATDTQGPARHTHLLLPKEPTFPCCAAVQPHTDIPPASPDPRSPQIRQYAVPRVLPLGCAIRQPTLSACLCKAPMRGPIQDAAAGTPAHPPPYHPRCRYPPPAACRHRAPQLAACNYEQQQQLWAAADNCAAATEATARAAAPFSRGCRWRRHQQQQRRRQGLLASPAAAAGGARRGGGGRLAAAGHAGRRGTGSRCAHDR